MTFDIGRIMATLPHRYPFLLVDRVVEFEAGQRIVGIKNVTVNEPFFPGHFPGNPVMPGVLIIEALAQVGALLIFGPDGAGVRDRYYYLAGVDKARFRRPVVPGDQLRLESEIMALRTRFCKMHCRATVEGQLVADAELRSMMVDAGDAQ